MIAQAGERNVLIFYSCWANHTQSIYQDDVYIMGHTPYSPYPEWNWWGKPLYAATHGDGTIRNNYRMYFDTPDMPNNDLLDWHAQLLDSAGVDAIVLDLTNGTQEKIVNGAMAICKRYEERQVMGLPTPKIVLWVKDDATLLYVETVIFSVFDDSIFLEYLGKKLVLANNTGDGLPAIPETGIWMYYTSRRMWGLGPDTTRWSFKVNAEVPPGAFMYNGEPEQMCAPVATQKTRMTMDGINPVEGAVGRQNGEYFIRYMDAAIAVGPRFLFIHSWNEWAAQNLGTQSEPWFVDMWKTEYSADIEPMEGGHGWQYFNLMMEKIGQYKDPVYTGQKNEHRESMDMITPPISVYPNPFHYGTTIRYDLQHSGWVRLAVFNIFGEKIIDLVNEHSLKGRRTVTWDGRDPCGNPVPSGVYYYKIKQGKLTDANIMIRI